MHWPREGGLQTRERERERETRVNATAEEAESLHLQIYYEEVSRSTSLLSEGMERVPGYDLWPCKYHMALPQWWATISSRVTHLQRRWTGDGMRRRRVKAHLAVLSYGN